MEFSVLELSCLGIIMFSLPVTFISNIDKPNRFSEMDFR